MGWADSLFDVYKRNAARTAISSDGDNEPLLPLNHTTMLANLQVTLNDRAEVLGIEVIDGRDAGRKIVVPCTDKSETSRQSVSPHPLCDKLMYLAGDLVEHIGEINDKQRQRLESRFTAYQKLISAWCGSAVANPKVRVVCDYINRECLIADLIAHHVFWTDHDGRLILEAGGAPKDVQAQWEGKSGLPPIFKAIKNTPVSMTNKPPDVILMEKMVRLSVRWIVHIPGDPCSEIWTDPEVRRSWIQFYSSVQKTGPMAHCMITGALSPIARLHPSRLLSDADTSRLICASSDGKDMTFRGRFSTRDEAVSIGSETSQYIHRALRWIIRKQGIRIGDIGQSQGSILLLWMDNDHPVVNPTVSSRQIVENDGIEWGGSDEPQDSTKIVDSFEKDFASKFRGYLHGYTQRIGDVAKVHIMILGRSSMGRLSVKHYAELSASEYLKRIENWHLAAAWQHTYFTQDGKLRSYFGCPSIMSVIKAAYSIKSLSDTLKDNLFLRILMAELTGTRFPVDVANNVYRRACSRLSFKTELKWMGVVRVHCSLYKMLHAERKYCMSIDETCRRRSYLFGRLLGWADLLEQMALYVGNNHKDRMTHAQQWLAKFSMRPASTWKQLCIALSPYRAKVLGFASTFDKKVGEISNLFEPGGFCDKPLDPEFLVTYYVEKDNYWKNLRKECVV